MTKEINELHLAMIKTKEDADYKDTRWKTTFKSLEGEKIPIEQQMNLGLFNYLGRIGNWFDKNL